MRHYRHSLPPTHLVLCYPWHRTCSAIILFLCGSSKECTVLWAMSVSPTQFNENQSDQKCVYSLNLWCRNKLTHWIFFQTLLWISIMMILCWLYRARAVRWRIVMAVTRLIFLTSRTSIFLINRGSTARDKRTRQSLQPRMSLGTGRQQWCGSRYYFTSYCNVL